MITKMVPQIDIFVSSPGDLMDERGAVQLVVERLNRITFRDECLLVPARYEMDVPPEVGDKAQFIVDNYMKVQKSHILICMLWARMGTPFTDPKSGTQYESGTYYEFLMGYEHLRQHQNPRILLYRKVDENAAADAEQKQKVDEFFSQFVGESTESKFEGIFSEFSQLQDFIDAIEAHLHQVVRKYVLAAKKHTMVQRPEFEEEPRRIDAAIPKQVALGTTTTLQVMVCLPDSEGLRQNLPETAKSKREVVKDDVRKGTLMVAFPKDPQTGELQSAEMKVEVSTSDFEFEDGCSTQTLRLAYRHDSGMLAFALKPLAANKQAKLTIRVKGPSLDGGELIYGTILVQTEITETVLQTLTNTASQVISTLLSGSFGSKGDSTTADESSVTTHEGKTGDTPSHDDSGFGTSLDDADAGPTMLDDIGDDFDMSPSPTSRTFDLDDADGGSLDSPAGDDVQGRQDRGDELVADDAPLDDFDSFEDDHYASYDSPAGYASPSNMESDTRYDRASSWGPAQFSWIRVLIFLLITALLLGGLIGIAIYSSNKPKDDSTTSPAAAEADTIPDAD